MPVGPALGRKMNSLTSHIFPQPRFLLFFGFFLQGLTERGLATLSQVGKSHPWHSLS